MALRTDDELAGLTEEEREGLLEEQEDEKARLLEAEQEDAKNKIEDEKQFLTKAERDAAKAALAAEATGTVVEPLVDEQRVKTAPYQPVPLLKAEMPADAQVKLTAIQTQMEALSTKLDDGDITAKEYMTGLRKLTADEAAIKEAVFKAGLATEMETSRVMDAWFRDVGTFMETHPEISRNATVYNAFDAIVRQVTGDAANAKMTGPQQLAKAYTQWAEDIGYVAPQAATTTAAKPAKPAREVPLTVGRVPATDATETENSSKFARLDRLASSDPIAYEAALAKLTDAERDAYNRE